MKLFSVAAMKPVNIEVEAESAEQAIEFAHMGLGEIVDADMDCEITNDLAAVSDLCEEPNATLE